MATACRAGPRALGEARPENHSVRGAGLPQAHPGPRIGGWVAPALAGLGSPWERQDGSSGRPDRGRILTDTREPSRGQQLPEWAQKSGRRHLAWLPGLRLLQPRSSRGRRRAERPLAGGGAELRGTAATLHGRLTLRMPDKARYP